LAPLLTKTCKSRQKLSTQKNSQWERETITVAEREREREREIELETDQSLKLLGFKLQKEE
jgi:hypothetical protein